MAAAVVVVALLAGCSRDDGELDLEDDGSPIDVREDADGVVDDDGGDGSGAPVDGGDADGVSDDGGGGR